MWYEVTIYYNAEVDSDIFSVDKDELLSFITFITTRINNLYSFNVVVKQS
ncbi:MAG: hypothetical protein WC179_08695 [Candidatus Cloacimonadaceae bacterium]|jgi:hypothetical protein